jgi:hypothetical protein
MRTVFMNSRLAIKLVFLFALAVALAYLMNPTRTSAETCQEQCYAEYQSCESGCLIQKSYCENECLDWFKVCSDSCQ